jgi:hypothetical protein
MNGVALSPALDRSIHPTLCSTALIRDRQDRRSSGKSGVKAFSITFGFATNQIVPDHSHYLHTQQRTQDYLELTESSHALRRLSAKRLHRGNTLGRPTRRSSFLGHMRKPFFRAPASADDHCSTQGRASSDATSNQRPDFSLPGDRFFHHLDDRS